MASSLTMKGSIVAASGNPTSIISAKVVSIMVTKSQTRHHQTIINPLFEICEAAQYAW